MTESEFSRIVDIRSITGDPVELEAGEAERAALARRFALVSIEELSARLDLEPDGGAINVTGTIKAAIIQTCAVSSEELPVTIDEPIALRFVPERTYAEDEEIELEEEELDEIEYTGTTFDLGEAVAQSLALAIDPYATGPEAEDVREEVDLTDEKPDGPFAALAALKKG